MDENGKCSRCCGNLVYKNFTFFLAVLEGAQPFKQ